MYIGKHNIFSAFCDQVVYFHYRCTVVYVQQERKCLCVMLRTVPSKSFHERRECT